MKKWVEKFIHQFEASETNTPSAAITKKAKEMSEDRATILYILDAYSKQLLEIEGHPVRKTRTHFEDLSRDLVRNEGDALEKTFFRIRQFFSSYRIAEFSYLQKTFDDFRNIIWDLIEQLTEGLETNEAEASMKKHFDELKDAVEANSIDLVKMHSRQFIDSYIEYQYRADQHKLKRIEKFKDNIAIVKRQLNEANHSMRTDHLTQAFNRKSFDEHIKKQWQLYCVTKAPVTLVILDIDHFKKINDTYGHAMGDAILIECVSLLKQGFARDQEFVARTGGEEFAVILSDYTTVQAAYTVEKMLEIIRKETYVDKDMRVKFTMSAGIAQLQEGESIDAWVKRADAALYYSKQNGRNRYTVSGQETSEKVS